MMLAPAKPLWLRIVACLPALGVLAALIVTGGWLPAAFAAACVASLRQYEGAAGAAFTTERNGRRRATEGQTGGITGRTGGTAEK